MLFTENDRRAFLFFSIDHIPLTTWASRRYLLEWVHLLYFPLRRLTGGRARALNKLCSFSFGRLKQHKLWDRQYQRLYSIRLIAVFPCSIVLSSPMWSRANPSVIYQFPSQHPQHHHSIYKVSFNKHLTSLSCIIFLIFTFFNII